LFKIKPPAPLPARRAYRPEGRAYAPEGHAKKITTPVRSPGPTPVKRQPQQFHRAGAEIGPRLNIKYGFNPDGIKRKINSIGQAGQAKRPFMDGH